jgi:ComF family protein
MVFHPLNRKNIDESFRIWERFFALPIRSARAVMEVLCPPCCAVCREPIDDSSQTLCHRCWLELQENLQNQACPVCGHSVGKYALIEGRCHRCQHTRPVVSHVIRVGDYNNTLRELILAFKFHRQSHLDSFLGALLAAAVMGAPALAQADLLVPIPLHWRRRWSRRYNQAELLARAAAENLKQQGRSIPVNCDLLRVRNTPPQTAMATMTDRLINLHGAFAVPRTDVFLGKHICLIDDVTTTGTTLRVAAQTIRKAGAKRISAAVLAVAADN